MKKYMIPAAFVTMVVIAGYAELSHYGSAQKTNSHAKIVVHRTTNSQTVQPNTTRQPSSPPHFSALAIATKDKQHFTLNPKSAQVVVGKSGTMVMIPANAFCDKNGTPVNGKVKMEMVEGIAPTDIVRMNLGTMSDQGALQTGGMIYLNAFSQSGDTLALAKDKEVQVEIQAKHVKAGMQLWQGVVASDGSLSWKNPQPLKNGLRAVPAESLGDSGTQKPLAKMMKGGKKRTDAIGAFYTDNAFRNSITWVGRQSGWGYSYSGGILNAASLVDAYKVSGSKIVNGQSVWKDTVYHWKAGMKNADSVVAVIKKYEQDGFVAEDGDVFLTDSGNTVLTNNDFSDGSVAIVRLDDKKFVNTNIATAEFRSRLPFIRQACDTRIIHCYTDFPNRALWKSDAAVADTLEKSGCPLAGLFRQFAKLKQDKIDPQDPNTTAALDAARTTALKNYSKSLREAQATFTTGNSFGSYSFGMKQLGWANVDRLCGGTNEKNMFFNVHVDGAANGTDVQATLIVPGLDLYICGYKRPNGDYSFTHGEYEQTANYPAGTNAFILSKCGSGNTLKFALKKIILGTNSIENITLQPGTEDELIRALGNDTKAKDSGDDAVVDDWYTQQLKSGGGCLCGDRGKK